MHTNINTLPPTEWWRLKSPASRWFAQPFVQAQIKENIKAPRHWPLCGEFTGDRWIPSQRASNAENISIWWRHHAPHHYNSWDVTEQHQRCLLAKPLLPFRWYFILDPQQSRWSYDKRAILAKVLDTALLHIVNECGHSDTVVRACSFISW